MGASALHQGFWKRRTMTVSPIRSAVGVSEILAESVVLTVPSAG